MPSPEEIKRQIDRIIGCLVEIGLANDQNFAFQRNLDDKRVEITFQRAEHVLMAMKDYSYQEIYEYMVQERAFCIKMPDGALIQMMYLFDGNDLERHRLAFFPAPHLEEFQNNPEIYLEDDIYAEVIARNIVPFPLRFDYDSREGVYKELEHPKSHLTLGQYENCRVPVTAPLTPFLFIDFILRSFYHTAFHHYADRLPCFDEKFDDTIFAREKNIIHMQLPRGAA